MSLITYEDKVALDENPQVADINKITANDMNQIKNAINNLFPVGFIIEVDNAEFDPNVSWGGTWERDKGHVIVSVDEDEPDFSTSGKTGGEKEVTLTVDEVPPVDVDLKGSRVGAHGDRELIYWSGSSDNNPGVGTTQGGGQPHNNMPPYYTAYRWIKTAM